MMKLANLRQLHPNFTYQGFSYQLSNLGLEVEFTYLLSPDIKFQPHLTIRNINQQDLDRLPEELLEELIFNLGLAEIPSYWKAACPRQIVIKAGKLSSRQVEFWDKLLLKGLGEFFYQNQLDFTQDDFIKWDYEKAKQKNPLALESKADSPNYLLPLGGGKDSGLTLGILDQHQIAYNSLILATNAQTIPSAQKQANSSQALETIVINREIDPKLLELNRQGYLNGHVPFSAYLSFLSLLVAALKGNSEVIVANERSANQGNLEYLGQTINHQYSKSYEYETDFRQYVSYILTGVEYKSVLRPLFELQIAKAFSHYPKYLQLSTSCNVGQKEGLWCHRCPKCLFVYTLLYPFTESNYLTSEVFDSDLFADKELISTALDLSGLGQAKPFECVGTFEETRAAFYLSIEKAKKQLSALPVVLKAIQTEFKTHPEFSQERLAGQAQEILHSWNNQHHLSQEQVKLLKSAL